MFSVISLLLLQDIRNASHHTKQQIRFLHFKSILKVLINKRGMTTFNERKMDPKDRGDL
jgi:hypothetical protein